MSVDPSLLQKEGVELGGGLERMWAGMTPFPVAVISLVGAFRPFHNKEIEVKEVEFADVELSRPHISILLMRTASTSETASVVLLLEDLANIRHSMQPRVIAVALRAELALNLATRVCIGWEEKEGGNMVPLRGFGRRLEYRELFIVYVCGVFCWVFVIFVLRLD